MEINEKYKVLADLMFPDVNGSIEELELKYPLRENKGAITRIAPSPTGFLHTGTLYTVLVNKKIANQTNGVFFVRIEDTDKKREVENSVSLLLNELKEFGIIPDEGVIADGEEKGNYGPYTQSSREAIYKICAKHLVEKGLAYPCFCSSEMLDSTRRTQEKEKQVTGYYGRYARCRNLSIDEAIEKINAGEKFITRFRSNGNHLKKMSFIDTVRGKIEMAENDQDIVIIKSDNLPTYHFAHAIDDHFMRTTDVIRGEEWLPSVPLHLELFRTLGFNTLNYGHLSSVMIKDGDSKRKLSKRKDKEAAVSHFLTAGYPKDSVIEYLLTIINSDYEPWRVKNPTLDKFDFEVKLTKTSSSGALFDLIKLNDVSKELIARMDSNEILENVLEWSKKYDNEMFEFINYDLEYSKKIFALERDNVKKIRKDIYKWEDIKPTFFYFFNELYKKDVEENGYSFDTLTGEVQTKIDKKTIKKVLELYVNNYDHNLEKDVWFENIKSLANEIGFCTDMKEYKQNSDKYIGSTADFAGVIRTAITNRKNTPDIYQIMQILGEDEVIKRLNDVVNNI